MNRLSSLPSVDKILRTEEAVSLSENFGRTLTTDAIRITLEEVRGKPETGSTQERSRNGGHSRPRRGSIAGVDPDETCSR